MGSHLFLFAISLELNISCDLLLINVFSHLRGTILPSFTGKTYCKIDGSFALLNKQYWFSYDYEAKYSLLFVLLTIVFRQLVDHLHQHYCKTMAVKILKISELFTIWEVFYNYICDAPKRILRPPS